MQKRKNSHPACIMPVAKRSTQLGVVGKAGCEKTIRLENYTLPHEVCLRSEVLSDLLETEGDVTLPVPEDLFQEWLAFAEVDSPSEPADTTRLADYASLLQACFMIHTRTHARRQTHPPEA